MKRDLQDSIAVILIILFCAGLYCNTLRNVFIFDDIHSIVENLYIKDSRYLPLIFKGYYTSDITVPMGMYRPILLLTFAFNYFFNGMQPAGYHIINILLHFLNGILLYSLIRFLKKDTPFGLNLAVTLLFISHPLNNEAVAYIACRSDLLVTFFILSGFLAYAKGRMLLPAFLFILALLTKENGLIFPFLIFAYDLINSNYYPDSAALNKKKNTFYLVLIGIFIFYWVFRRIIFSPSYGYLFPFNSPVRNFSSNILTQAAVTFYYLRLFIWPYPLSLNHVFPLLRSLTYPLAWLSILGILAIIFLIFRLRKRQPLISLGLSWYLICLLPKFYAVLNIVAAEHHFYLPGIGIFWILLAGLEPLYLRFRRKFIYIYIGIIGIFFIIILSRNFEWKDSFTFWRTVVRDEPRSAGARHNLGIEYSNMGLYQESEEELKISFALAKELPDVQRSARENLANAYKAEKRFKEALEQLNKNLELRPNDFITLQNLGVVYLEMGDEAKAKEMWERGLRLNPMATGIYFNLGAYYLRHDDLKMARLFFRSAIEADPDSYLAHAMLAYIYEKKLNYNFAIASYEKAISLNPTYVLAHYNVSNLYSLTGDYDKAVRHLKEVIKLYPNHAEAHNNLAVVYSAIKPAQWLLAKSHAQKAISLGYKVDERLLKIIDSALKQ